MRAYFGCQRPKTYLKNMKIAVISEIHGNLSTLQAVLAEIGAAGLDRVIKVASPAGGHFITFVNPGSVGLPAYEDNSSL